MSKKDQIVKEFEYPVFDGEVVVIADREFDEDKPFKVVVKTEYSDQAILVNNILIDLMISRAKIVDCLSDAQFSFEELDKYNKHLAYYFKALKKNLNKKILETILEGRLKMAFLIDSFGGTVTVGERYNEAARLVTHNNGQVEAFVTGSACSAAFQMMMDCENVYALKKSSLMWHYSTDLDGKKLSFEEQDAELEALYKFLYLGNGAMMDMLVKRVKANVNRPDNYEGDIYFTGLELAKADCISYYFSNVSGMNKFFSRNYLSAVNPVVEDFWVDSRVMIQSIAGRADWHGVEFEELRQAAVRRRG